MIKKFIIPIEINITQTVETEINRKTDHGISLTKDHLTRITKFDPVITLATETTTIQTDRETILIQRIELISIFKLKQSKLQK